jgi:thiol:disulfide interchange protein
VGSTVLAVAALADLGNWAETLSSRLSGQLEGASVPLALLLFFAGGVLASLTPCVYPMIPIVVAYMGGAETAAVAAGAAVSGRRRRVILRALAYVGGMALVYTGLGVAAALLGQTFGAMTQTFWAYALVALVLVVFGLGLLGLFEIRVPSFIMHRVGTGPRQGLAGAALMGATSGVVAAPCAAPIVFPLLTLVGQGGRVVFGTLGMFCFSLGLGLLFLLLGIFSGMAASLPRPGPWMVTLKKTVGVVMIVIGVFFAYKGWQRW